MIQTAPVHCLEAYVPAPLPALGGIELSNGFAIWLRGCIWESECGVLFVATNQIGARVRDAQCPFNKVLRTQLNPWQQASLSSNRRTEFRRQWTWGWPECKAIADSLKNKPQLRAGLFVMTTTFVWGHGQMVSDSTCG
jgi:hypothetical protein